MVLAADYPLLNAFWTILFFFLWVLWFWLLITVFIDLFRSDMSGWVKALWAIVLIFLPLIGVLIYLIVNGRHMAERSAREAQAAQAQIDDRIRTVAGSNGSGAASEIEKASQLLASGAITQAEYDQIKQKALA